MSNAAPGNPDADRNLLFGILAVQMDFVSRVALTAAMNAWVRAKDQALGDILQEHGALKPGRRQLLGAMVNEHLDAHGGDVHDDHAMRGESENHNKKLKCDLAIGRTRAHGFVANFFRLYLRALALNLGCACCAG
jgi:hypothetical protein